MGVSRGWQRIGIVAGVMASLAWAVAVIIHTEGETSWATMAYKECLDSAHEKPALEVANASSKCISSYFANQDTVKSQRQAAFYFYSLIPIALGWSLAYAVIGAARWVRSGFASEAVWLDDYQLAAVNDWRQRQSNPPTQAEAVRRLIQRGLEAERSGNPAMGRK